MQKRIYALWSPGSKGKTTTGKLIAGELHRLFPAAPVLPDAAALSGGEINIQIVIGKLKIGITSQGDPGTGLYQRLEKHALDGCHIIVCTTRTRGETEEAVEETERRYGFRAVWFTNYQSGFPGEHAFLNEASATRLVSLMRAMCGF
ncbi:MAG: hypothetical protein JWP69_1679 [Flaviaesturariibacter sp.]|nr:hypothetical protein [Flaviaesturariibacter sp.]